MNFARCMMNKCKDCKYEASCFKNEQNENQYRKDKRKSTTANLVKKVMEVGELN